MKIVELILREGVPMAFEVDYIKVGSILDDYGEIVEIVNRPGLLEFLVMTKTHVFGIQRCDVYAAVGERDPDS